MGWQPDDASFRVAGHSRDEQKDLVDMFGVARDTARRAVQALREAGLVVTVPQRGTYVLPTSGPAETQR